MPSFSNLDDRRGGVRRTETSIQSIKFCRSHHAPSFPVLCRLLALLLALAVAPPVLLAQEWDHLNGRDKACDPTGAWLVTDTGAGSDGQPSVLATFHKDGTTSGDVRGDITGYPNPIFVSPEQGLWKKTGARTFTATFVALEYNRDNSLFAIFKVQANFRLYASGDQYDADYVARETLPNGHVNTFPPGRPSRVPAEPRLRGSQGS